MEIPGNDLPSENTDPYTTNDSFTTSPIQNIPSTSPNRPPTNISTISMTENNDSESDVSMSADSEDEDEDTTNTPSIQLNSNLQAEQTNGTILKPTQPELSRKRKYLDAEENDLNGHNDPENFEEVHKRLKPDEIQSPWRIDGHLQLNRSLLPAELWHHIFTFTPPRTLGNLLQVNKSFNRYLNPSSDSSVIPLSKSTLQLLKPDAIWRASRRHFKPSMPVPLIGQTELNMWRIACTMSCQFCGKRKAPTSIPLDQWHPGPGENGVLPVWVFAVQSCGTCLLQNSVKEYELLLSSSVPSLVMPALPFIFLTNELHVISPTALQNSQTPATVQITKYYFKKHIDAIKDEFESVKTMGSATVEEWLKGLEDRGRERRTDAARWERWDANGGVTKMQYLEEHEKSKQVPAAIVPNSLSALSVQKPITYPLPQAPKSLPAIHTSFPNNTPPRYDSPSQSVFSAYTPRLPPQPRQERTKEEVADLKAARRAEIERRCLSLDPPLTANILAHMSSFQAAIQIIQPLTDGAWEMLKPRILSQRGEAEQRENDRIAQTRVVQERSEERRFQDMPIKSEFKDTMDREWDDVQAPLRARIGGYAEETIRDGWSDGDKVTKESSPRFAADVLIYVRKRFYAEVAKDDAAVRATGREPQVDPPMGPFTRKLTLENMKWVFDTKIKPHTEQYSKELFLCNACENNYKYYGFEGVIQHFAAKHTNTLSVGSVVVHWKSEWPEYPPFNPDPNTAVKNAYYSAAPSASAPYSNSSVPSSYGYGGYQQPVSASYQTPNPNGYQDSPGAYYGHSQYGDQYPVPSGPYQAPHMYQEPMQGYAQYSAPPSAITPIYTDPPQTYVQPGYGPYPTSSQAAYTPITNMYSNSVPDSNVQQSSYTPQGAQYDYSYSQSSAYVIGQPSTQPPQQPHQSPQLQQPSQQPHQTEEYKAQLRDLGRDARAIWTLIGTIKDVPGSVKVYTIIYHILKGFRTKFQQDPPLAMIVDGLSNNKDMRPVRNVNGLLCRACVLGMAGSITNSKSDKKHFSFPQLANHFHSIHEQGIPSNFVGHFPDWTKDMVELPDQAKVSSVARVPMDEQKLAIFTEALPEIFVAPSRKNSIKPQSSTRHARPGPLEQVESDWQPASHPNLDANGALAPSQDNHGKYYTIRAENGGTDTGSANYQDNQYDPYSPHVLQERDVRNSGSLATSSRHDQNTHVLYDDDTGRRFSMQGPATPPTSYIKHGGDYGRYTTREEGPFYLDTNVRYRETNAPEHRPRYERPIRSYEDTRVVSPMREYRAINSQSYQSNRQEQAMRMSRPPPETQYQSLEDAKSQQNKIFEVVAQISQQAEQARGKRPIKREAVDIPSENDDLHGQIAPQHTRKRPSDEADRFLNNLLPDPKAEVIAQKPEQAEIRKEGDIKARWEPERVEVRQRHPTSPEPQRRLREVYDNDMPSSVRSAPMAGEQGTSNGYYLSVQERQPQARQTRAYPPDDRYIDSVSEQSLGRERSSEVVERRYKPNNVIYHDERQGSTHRTLSRYARYESVRLENDRARSRSPVYVKMGGQSGQYVEHSPSAHHSHQEPTYRTRTPDEVFYERAPRQEYYRVYADEPRPRQSYEYVQYDSQGPYVVHRQVRRGPEAVYSAFDDDPYSARQPVYDTRPAVSRSDPAYYEEYDPRHPEPPSTTAAAREVRYQ